MNSLPYFQATAVTPHDVTVIAGPMRALWVGGAGNLTVVMKDDTASVLIENIAQGTLLPISAKLVMATGTTATKLIALR